MHLCVRIVYQDMSASTIAVNFAIAQVINDSLLYPQCHIACQLSFEVSFHVMHGRVRLGLSGLLCMW